MEQWIFHVDMDAFFASVSLLSHPELRPNIVVVAGNPNTRHGVVLAKNQAAKKLGIKTAMSLAEARRIAKDLIVLPPEHDKYRDYSRRAMAIYSEYSPLVESFGLDECWIALSTQDPETMARKLQAEIATRLSLTVSIGIAKDKVMAKLASDWKKPNGIVCLKPEELADRVWPLPIEKLLFVGKASAEKLHDLGIRTIGDIAACPAEVLHASLGKIGLWLHEAARGENKESVATLSESKERKSISSMETLVSDISTAKTAQPILQKQLEEVVASLQHKHYRAKCLQIWYKDVDFQSFTRQIALSRATDGLSEFVPALEKLIREELDFSKDIRALGVGLTQLESSDLHQQMNLSEWLDISPTQASASEKEKQLMHVLDSINTEIGKEIIKRGS